MDRIQYLSQFNLMHSLSESDLIEMDKLTVITTVPKHTFIQTPDTFIETLYFIKKGKVRLYRLSEEGKQFTLDILGEGNIFGEMEEFSLGTRGLFIETIVESDICMMDKERFRTYVIQHPQFMMNMLKAISERLSNMSSLAQNLALGKLHDKIIHALIELFSRFGVWDESCEFGKIDMPLSHAEIAHLVGASREAVSIALKELADSGVLQVGFRSIALHRDVLTEQNGFHL
ncbi:Crp/Fnr family transcriptional regulator [Paenibacillus pinisoli]|uniref:Crp/Fnr family transcriptional regulator n=1 Tax=Paenibacillus pinisoli TaxID=1276110 RepID=A0A3A6PSB3_9BACL|nr:Crp/Fnr family transcriptional regulator [Paenibacillus pinisoli]RJX39541.1 Crp/Fnr family transcriptional regulator [Paenibacillus pinisoli]